MPIYEYACERCGHRLEIQQRVSEPKLRTCPACGQDALEKLISLSSFQLKGGGWYKDGYGSSPTKRSETQVSDRLSKATDSSKKDGSGAPSSSSSGSSSSSTASGSSSSSSSSSGATAAAA